MSSKQKSKFPVFLCRHSKKEVHKIYISGGNKCCGGLNIKIGNKNTEKNSMVGKGQQGNI